MTIKSIIGKHIGGDKMGRSAYNEALHDIREKIPQMEREILEVMADWIIKQVRSGKFAGSFSDGCDCEMCDKHEKKVRKEIIKALTTPTEEGITN